jgi:ubiquinone/menaquinone biosynthesis C-methylase UbiE
VTTDYDQLADRYDEDRAGFSVAPDDIVVELASSPRPTRVLDLGCGTGTWLAAQQARTVGSGVTLLGADPSTAMLAVAHGKGIANLMRAGAEQLPIPDSTIDYVVANFTFHHWQKERSLNEVRRVLRADHAVFRINNIEPEKTLGSWLYQCFPETVAIDAERFWPTPRIAEELEARGFVVDVRRESTTVDVHASQALAAAERRVISQLANLDEDAYARGLARLRSAARSHGSVFTTTSATVRVTARRV